MTVYRVTAGGYDCVLRKRIRLVITSCVTEDGL